MILAIDIGNTNIVFGLIREGEIVTSARTATDRTLTEEEYASAFSGILSMKGISLTDIEGSILSSVVPPLNRAVSRAVALLLGKEPLLVGPGIRTGLKIRYDNPAQLGSDRVVDAVGAIAKHGFPLILFDMGTATTVSVIDNEGAYAGGMILPGVRISLDCLSGRASQLPHISLESPPGIVGRNTVDCMKSGIIYGTASMIDGLIDRLREETGTQAPAIATGGLARFILPYCRRQILHEKDLLLTGLWIIYQKNSGKP